MKKIIINFSWMVMLTGLFALLSTETAQASEQSSHASVSLTDGGLSIKEIQYHLSFGKIEKPQKDTTYLIETQIEICDTRENLPGWKLSVSKADEKWHKGLQLAVGTKEKSVIGASQEVLQTTPQKYKMNQMTDVKLFLNVSPDVALGSYQTVLNWELASLPKGE